MPTRNVLIVDDAMDVARLLRNALVTRCPDLNIAVVPSAEEGILEAARRPIHLLVSDIRLPGITGLELVKKIRARRPEVKVMLVTGLSDSRVIFEAQELKVDALLYKPLDMSDYVEAAMQCLAQECEEKPDIDAALAALDQASKTGELARASTGPLNGSEPSKPPQNEPKSPSAAAEQPTRSSARPRPEPIPPARPAPQSQPRPHNPPPFIEEPSLAGESPALEYLAPDPVVPDPPPAVQSVPAVQPAPVVEPAPAAQKPAPVPQARSALLETIDFTVLDKLRQDLSAVSVILVDPDGSAAAASGSLPDDCLEGNYEQDWKPLFAQAFAVQSHLTVRLGSHVSANATAIRGENQDIILAGLPGGGGLALVIKSGRSVLRLTLALEEVLTTSDRLIEAQPAQHPSEPAVLKIVPAASSDQPPASGADPVDAAGFERLLWSGAGQPSAGASPAGVSSARPGEPPPDFLSIFNQPVDQSSADRFWETQEDTSISAAGARDTLNYDQALQRGLAPKELDES